MWGKIAKYFLLIFFYLLLLAFILTFYCFLLGLLYNDFMKKKYLLLDKMLMEKWAADEKEALALVMTGNVLVNDYPAASIHEKVTDDCVVRIRGKAKGRRYVTRAGLKLEGGFESFNVTAEGKVCLDIGAAEGGFTDCLLVHGAARVYAVDVAYGIFDWRLRNNEKVVVLERTNARYLNERLITEKIDLLTGDVSFISLRVVLPGAMELLKPDGVFIVLYKPQFELPREQIGKNGNVDNLDFIAANLGDLFEFFRDKGIFVRGLAVSPVRGSNGNEEFLLFGDKDAGRPAPLIDIQSILSCGGHG